MANDDNRPLFDVRSLSVDESDGPVEYMGSKKKFWLADRDTEDSWLVKFSRPDTGEHWSEKLAAEVASLIGVPHAEVELGELAGHPVSLSKNFLRTNEKLNHGNELLSGIDPSYPRDVNYRVREHTVQAVHDVLCTHSVGVPAGTPDGVESAFGVFVGYLLLDALIGNTDRHHENWAIIRTRASSRLAPSYDHASSLGREHRDQKRHKIRMMAQGIQRYCLKARSAFYAENKPGRPLSCLQVFENACSIEPVAATFWRERVAMLEQTALRDLIWRVPDSCMSEESRLFALAVIDENRCRLLRASS